MQEHIIFRWLSLKSTIEYLGEWETLYNPLFNCTEFGANKNAIGIRSKSDRYGGTYAHREINYRIHTDAIKRNIIPEEVTSQQASIIYANEADVLNVAMFGMTNQQAFCSKRFVRRRNA